MQNKKERLSGRLLFLSLDSRDTLRPSQKRRGGKRKIDVCPKTPEFFVNFVPDKLLESMDFGFLKIAAATPGVSGIAATTSPESRIDSGSRPAGVSVAAFPVLCITGYTCGDLFGQPFPDRTSRTGSRTAARRHGLPAGRSASPVCRWPSTTGSTIRPSYSAPASFSESCRRLTCRITTNFTKRAGSPPARNPTAKRSNCADSRFRSRPTCFSKTGKSVSVSKSAKICGFRTRRPPASQWPGPPCWSICRQATKWSASTLISVR